MMWGIFAETLFLLLVGHAVADYALQSDWIANNKNRHAIPKGYDPQKHGPRQTVWPYVLSAHGLVHGGMVYLVTGHFGLALFESVAHILIDAGKCEKLYGIHRDQFFHFICKVFVAFMIATGG